MENTKLKKEIKDEKKKAVQLEMLTGYYRIKFDRNNRIMVQWNNSDPMRILQVIPRKNLETWIKNKGHNN